MPAEHGASPSSSSFPPVHIMRVDHYLYKLLKGPSHTEIRLIMQKKNPNSEKTEVANQLLLFLSTNPPTPAEFRRQVTLHQSRARVLLDSQLLVIKVLRRY